MTDKADATHAGGIVLRRTEDGVRYLVVTAKSNPRHWVLPKGHIEPGETAKQTARREVKEESGVEAEVVRPIGRIRYRLDKGEIVVEFFLMKFVSQSETLEKRELRWLSFDEAVRTLTFKDTGRLLQQAHLEQC